MKLDLFLQTLTALALDLKQFECLNIRRCSHVGVPHVPNGAKKTQQLVSA